MDKKHGVIGIGVLIIFLAGISFSAISAGIILKSGMSMNENAEEVNMEVTDDMDNYIEKYNKCIDNMNRPVLQNETMVYINGTCEIIPR